MSEDWGGGGGRRGGWKTGGIDVIRALPRPLRSV